MTRHGRWIAPAGTLLLCAALVLPGCRKTGPVLRRETRLLMDTYVAITACAPAHTADKALDDAFARLEAINRKFDFLDTTSPLYAFNERGVPLTDPEIVGVLVAADSVSRLSGGVFDVTVEPLVELWGFYSGHLAVPSQRAIDSCRQLVGYRNLGFEPGRVTKLRPWVKVDLGGIAKGYALDEAARVLRADGVDSAIIDAGGDVYAIGTKGSEKWRVGIRNPRGDGVVGVATVSDLAVVTSGDYERYFFGPDSVRYCHIIDPRTGWPARGTASTTVFMRDPLTAQGWSKVLFILGPGALGLLDSMGGIEALLVSDSMKVTATPGLTGTLELTPTDTGR